MELKKIQSKKEIEKKQKRNQLVIGLILIFVMLISTAGYAFDQTRTEKKIYNNIVFVKQESNLWQAQKIGTLTQFLPQEVAIINGSVSISKSQLDGKIFYFDIFSSDELNAANEVMKNLAVAKTQQICIEGEENKEGCENLAIKSCFDENLNNYIFVFKSESNSTLNLEKKGYCIFFNADGENLIKATDKFIFIVNNIL